MRIALCHNYYQLRGGEDQVFEDERSLLRAHGHDVFDYTVHNDSVADHSKLTLARQTVWNRRAANEIAQLVRRERIDVVHFHNTFPLISPAAYYGAHRAGAAVVQTLHNYRLHCPAATRFRCGTHCDDCIGKLFAWPAVKHKCYRGSRSATAVLVTMLSLHRLRGTWNREVDRYIALTAGGRQRFVDAGWPAERIEVKPNFIQCDPGAGPGGGSYAIFVGRLSEEKGIRTVLDAWSRCSELPRLKLVGEGPLEHLVQAAAERDKRIEPVGFRPLDEIYPMLGAATCLVMPSVWHEPFGRTVIEAFAKGTPVLASRVGALAELVTDGLTGNLFPAADADALAETLMQMQANPSNLQRMRIAAREEYEAHYTPAANYAQLHDIYQRALTQATLRNTHPSDVATSTNQSSCDAQPTG